MRWLAIERRFTLTGGWQHSPVSVKVELQRKVDTMARIKVTFIEADGAVRTFENAETGQSLMELGRANNVAGILADCGGACACATCHVYVDAEWLNRVGLPDELEAGMLDLADNKIQNNSRLSCQIRLAEELDGLKVTVAPLF
jgi:2Fe-2S ferredoxin